eukprot:TRINITY_DN2893_c0_g1_i7.p1 TRINITY_DN2893_c0_g1~~TRINITY_DN2893_c0_g1_i7.p1  ORF type:complete len:1482 (-),score=356.23 TRINITY_DN2893_c0_g1_i7:2446-6351(-)
MTDERSAMATTPVHTDKAGTDADADTTESLFVDAPLLQPLDVDEDATEAADEDENYAVLEDEEFLADDTKAGAEQAFTNLPKEKDAELEQEQERQEQVQEKQWQEQAQQPSRVEWMRQQLARPLGTGTKSSVRSNNIDADGFSHTALIRVSSSIDLPEEEKQQMTAEVTTLREARKHHIEEKEKEFKESESQGMNRPVIVGTCQKFCPHLEVLERTLDNTVSAIEKKVGKTFKNYRRNVAGDDITALSEEIRPCSVLREAMDVLVNSVADLEGEQFFTLYSFMRDRSRSIRQDAKFQNLTDAVYASILENQIRFFILAGHRLCNHPQFTRGQNSVQMEDCFSSLKQCYLAMARQGQPCPNRAEFLLYMLLGLPSAEFINSLCQLPKDTSSTHEVKLAVETWKALFGMNWSRFFRQIVVRAPYLAACCMHVHFAHIRVNALHVLARALKKGDSLPLDDVASMLCFNDTKEAQTFLSHFGLEFRSGAVILGGADWPEEQDQLPPEFVCNLIENKVRGLPVRIILSGGTAATAAAAASVMPASVHQIAVATTFPQPPQRAVAVLTRAAPAELLNPLDQPAAPIRLNRPESRPQRTTAEPVTVVRPQPAKQPAPPEASLLFQAEASHPAPLLDLFGPPVSATHQAPLLNLFGPPAGAKPGIAPARPTVRRLIGRWDARAMVGQWSQPRGGCTDPDDLHHAIAVGAGSLMPAVLLEKRLHLHKTDLRGIHSYVAAKWPRARIPPLQATTRASREELAKKLCDVLNQVLPAELSIAVEAEEAERNAGMVPEPRREALAAALPAFPQPPVVAGASTMTPLAFALPTAFALPAAPPAEPAAPVPFHVPTSAPLPFQVPASVPPPVPAPAPLFPPPLPISFAPAPTVALVAVAELAAPPAVAEQKQEEEQAAAAAAVAVAEAAEAEMQAEAVRESPAQVMQRLLEAAQRLRIRNSGDDEESVADSARTAFEAPLDVPPAVYEPLLGRLGPDIPMYWKLLVLVPEEVYNPTVVDFVKNKLAHDPNAVSDLHVLSMYTAAQYSAAPITVTVCCVSLHDDQQLILRELRGTAGVILVLPDITPAGMESCAAAMRGIADLFVLSTTPTPLLVVYAASAPVNEVDRRLKLEGFDLLPRRVENLGAAHVLRSTAEGADRASATLMRGLLWLAERAAPAPRLLCGSLQELLTQKMEDHLFPLFANVYARVSPVDCVLKFNALLACVATELADDALANLSWPIYQLSMLGDDSYGEFPPQEWNTPENLQQLRDMLTALVLPQPTVSSDDDAATGTFSFQQSGEKNYPDAPLCQNSIVQ